MDPSLNLLTVEDSASIPETMIPIVHFSTSPIQEGDHNESVHQDEDVRGVFIKIKIAFGICNHFHGPSSSTILMFNLMYPDWDIKAIRKTGKALRKRVEHVGRKHVDVAGGIFGEEMRNLWIKMYEWNVQLEGIRRGERRRSDYPELMLQGWDPAGTE